MVALNKLLTILTVVLIITIVGGQLELCKNFVSTLDFDSLQVGNKRMVYFAHERSWPDAFEECKKIGMRLVTIDNEEENKALYRYFVARVWGKDGQALDFTYWYIWSAGTDVGHEGHFIWKSTGQNVTYTAWGGGEPNGGDGENCIELRYTLEGNLLWNDSICWLRKRYICETDNVIEPDI